MALRKLWSSLRRKKETTSKHEREPRRKDPEVPRPSRDPFFANLKKLDDPPR